MNIAKGNYPHDFILLEVLVPYPLIVNRLRSKIL